MIGLIAGTISVVGYVIIQLRLQKATGGVDTCVVHNLHGMLGVFRDLVAMGLVAFSSWQLTGTILSMAFTVITGVRVGVVTSRLGLKETSQ